MAIAVWLGAGVAAAEAPHAPAVFARLDEGKLTLHARDAAGEKVLSAVTDATGVRFDVDPGIDLGRVTLDLDALDLERAIRLLLDRFPNAPARTLSYEPGADGQPGLTLVRMLAPRIPGAAPSVESVPDPVGADGPENEAAVEPPSVDLPDADDEVAAQERPEMASHRHVMDEASKPASTAPEE